MLLIKGRLLTFEKLVSVLGGLCYNSQQIVNNTGARLSQTQHPGTFQSVPGASSQSSQQALRLLLFLFFRQEN